MPTQPQLAEIRKNVTLSTKTSIYLEWTKVADQQVQTTGYLLWMAANPSGSANFTLIMNGTGRPELNEFDVRGLQTGAKYRFKLQALNFNGASTMSDEFEFNSCIYPSSMPSPYRVSSTTASILLAWTEPLDDGGCPITGYAVFRDEGDSSTPSVEVDASIRGVPTLRQLNATNLPSGKEGEYVRFSVTAFNREGFANSTRYTAIMFASEPAAPS